MKPHSQTILLFLIFPFLAITGTVEAQKKALGKPLKFEGPVDVFDDETKYADLLEDTQSKSKDEAWLVISDRDDNPCYETPDLGSQVTATMQFRDMYYVLEERDGWVKLIDATMDGLKIIHLKKTMGWVPKQKLLLWNYGLITSSTRIHKKAMLLNRADDIQNVLKLKDKHIVDIYRSPDAEVREPERHIFEFYFILKKEKGRYLLCEEAVFSPFSIEKITGWVSSRRCSPWDTRVCLEPAFTPEAFHERQQNPPFTARAFKTEEAARLYSETRLETDVYWKDDPVNLRHDKMAKSNPRRFNGYVMRFPVLGVNRSFYDQTQDTFVCYRTGIIGSIKVRKSDSKSEGWFDSEIAEHDYSQIKTYVNDLGRRSEHVNVFFVVEATDSSFAYREGLAKALLDLSKNQLKDVPDVRYGVLLYRDVAEQSVRIGGKNTDRLIEYMPLTASIDKVVQFIQHAEFRNYVDRDEYTALYYGLQQTMMQAQFPKDALNILFLMGNYGDYRIDRDRKSQAKSTGDKTLLEDLTPLLENMNTINAHLYVIQLRNDGARPAEGFAVQGQYMILETAKFSYNQFYGNRNNPFTREMLDRLKREHHADVVEPSMDDVLESTDILLKGGLYPGRLVRPASGRYISPARLKAVIAECAKSSLEFEQNLNKIVQEVFIKGEKLDLNITEGEYLVDAGRFAPALADWLNTILADDQVSQNDLLASLDDKYKLYAEAYIPDRIKEAKFPTYNFVLFMPEHDLIMYQRTIERSLATLESSNDKKRESLFDIYTELVIQFSGETLLRQKKPSDFTRSELFQIMQGLYGSGLSPDIGLDVRIRDIRDERKVSDEDIDHLLKRFQTVEKTLTHALRMGEQYDFCYSSDSNNRYYWIPVSDAF